MYRCFESTQIISILDVPQFVIDASISSSIAASKSSESERLKSLTASKATSPNGGDNPAPTTADGPDGQPTSGGGEDAGANDGEGGGGDTTNNTTNNDGDSTNNTPAIVGGAVGSLAALIIICLLVLCLMRRKRKSKKTGRQNKTKQKNTVANTVGSNQYSSEGRQGGGGLLSRVWGAISGARGNKRRIRKAPVYAANPDKMSSDSSRSHADIPQWPLAPPSAMYGNDGRQPSRYPSHPPPPMNSTPATAELQDPSIATSNYAIQQHLQQQQAQSTPGNPSLTSNPPLERDATGSSGNTEMRNPSDTGGSYTGSQQQPPLRQSGNSGNMAGAGVPITSSSGHAATQPGSMMAFYQQPQHTGGAAVPQPHNFTFVLNHYTNGPMTSSDSSNNNNTQAASTNRDVHGGPSSGAGPAPPSEALQTQSTDRSSVATGPLRAQGTGNSGIARGLSTSTAGSRRGRGAVSPETVESGTNYVAAGGVSDRAARNTDEYPPSATAARPRRSESKNSSRGDRNYAPSPPARRTSRTRESTSTARTTSLAGLGPEARAIAMAGLSLELNHHTSDPQQPQQQNHHHHHYYPGPAPAASAPDDESRARARNPRYTDDSRMTTATTTPPPPATDPGVGHRDMQEDTAGSVAGYQNRQVTGDNGRAPMEFSVDIGFETEVTQTDDRGVWVQQQQQQGSGTSVNPGWQGQSRDFTGGSSSGTTNIRSMGTGERGVGEGQGPRGGAAWYQRPVGMESDEPVELEASPALRKVD